MVTGIVACACLLVCCCAIQTWESWSDEEFDTDDQDVGY